VSFWCQVKVAASRLQLKRSREIDQSIYPHSKVAHSVHVKREREGSN